MAPPTDTVSTPPQIWSGAWPSIAAPTPPALGDDLQLLASLQLPTLTEARALERELKRKKKPELAFHALHQRDGLSGR